MKKFLNKKNVALWNFFCKKKYVVGIFLYSYFLSYTKIVINLFTESPSFEGHWSTLGNFIVTRIKLFVVVYVCVFYCYECKTFWYELYTQKNNKIAFRTALLIDPTLPPISTVYFFNLMFKRNYIFSKIMYLNQQNIQNNYYNTDCRWQDSIQERKIPLPNASGSRSFERHVAGYT